MWRTTLKARDRKTVAFLLASALFASACSGGGSSEADSATTTSTPSTSAPTTSAPPTTASNTTTEAPTTTAVLPETLDELAEFIQIREDDLPAGYSLSAEEPGEDNMEICDGIDGLRLAHPPAARSEKQFEGDHFLLSNVAVYETNNQAREAFLYLGAAYLECDGGFLLNADGEEVLLEARSFSALPVSGIEDLDGYLLLQTTREFGVLLEANLALVDKVVFLVASTDGTVVNSMSETVVERIAGNPTVTEIIPTGSAEFQAGYRTPEYFSWIAGPDQLRDVAFQNEGANAWIQASGDERLDAMSANACVTVQDLESGDGVATIDSVILSVFDAAELQAHGAESLGELYGTALAIYCPGLSDFLQEVIAASPDA